MGLTLAVPAMLAGLLLLAVPIIAHLTGYREVRTVDFPTLRFLRASELKVRRRRRFESLLLLALRLAAIAALVMLFVRPNITWTATALAGLDPLRTTVVLLDVSASMTAEGDRGPVFEDARTQARRLVEGLSDGTQAALVIFDKRATVLGPGLTADRTALLRELDEVSVGAGATDLDAALRRARRLLRDSAVGDANIFVLSDGTATALPGSYGADWPDELTVHYHDLMGPSIPNRYVASGTVRGGLRRGEGVRVDAEVRAVGDRPGRPVPLSLTLGDGTQVAVDVEFDGAGKADASFSLPMPPAGRREAVLELAEDAMSIDDRWPFVLEGDSELDVLLVSGDGGSNPREDETWFLETALQPGPGSPSRVRPRVVRAEELRHVGGGHGDVVFLCNVADPRPLVPELEAFVRRGGGLFISVGRRVDPDLYNDALSSLLPAHFTELKTRGRSTFEDSPMGLSVPPLETEEFRVFRTGGAGVFARVGFGKVMGTEPRLATDSEVLLRYTDGLPALLDRRIGEGRVVVFTSTLDDDWTDLPLRSIYVSLVHQFARSLSGTLLLDGGQGVEVGGTVALPVPPDPGRRAWVVTPDGRERTLDAGASDAEGRVSFSATDSPGHYELRWEDRSGAQPEGLLRGVFSARVPASESARGAADRDALLASVPGLVHHGEGGPVTAEAPGQVIRTASLAPLALALLALMLLGEGIVATRRA